jgi:hypothetical protein
MWKTSVTVAIALVLAGLEGKAEERRMDWDILELSEVFLLDVAYERMENRKIVVTMRTVPRGWAVLDPDVRFNAVRVKQVQ